MKQKRQNSRSRVLKGAKIIVGASSLLDCVVRDMNNSGARIKIPNAVDLPDKFVLAFEDDRFRRQCRVMWRTLNEVGIEFARAESQQSAA